MFGRFHQSAADLAFYLTLVHLKYCISSLLQYHFIKIWLLNQLPEEPSVSTVAKTSGVLRQPKVILGAKYRRVLSFRKCTSWKNVCSFYTTLKSNPCAEGQYEYACYSEDNWTVLKRVQLLLPKSQYA